MEYCTRCGCYIPDGQSECPACGHGSAAAAAVLKKPAETRETKKEEYRKWADEEVKRRKEEKESIAEQENTEKEKTGEKLLAALSYISILCFLPDILKSGSFAGYHAKQGKKLLCAAIIGDIIGYYFSAFWGIQLIRLLFVLFGIKTAIQGKEEPLPVLGGSPEDSI